MRHILRTKAQVWSWRAPWPPPWHFPHIQPLMHISLSYDPLYPGFASGSPSSRCLLVRPHLSAAQPPPVRSSASRPPPAQSSASQPPPAQPSASALSALSCNLQTGQQGNLRICDMRINQYKFANLRFADWHTSEICGFAICGLK
jgi:hypothetical protein